MKAWFLDRAFFVAVLAFMLVHFDCAQCDKGVF